MLSGNLLYAKTLRSETAILVVDVQECFTEGGSLAVPGANRTYVKSVENALRLAKKEGVLILGSRDYHPEGHVSFASSHPGSSTGDVIVLPNGVPQKLWPDHCVQTMGDSREAVDNNLFFELVKKGEDPNVDSPSAFKDDLGRLTELNAILQEHSIKSLVVFGLATEVCVKETIEDALRLNYSVAFIEELSRGITPEGVANAISDMRSKGVDVLQGKGQLNRYVRQIKM